MLNVTKSLVARNLRMHQRLLLRQKGKESGPTPGGPKPGGPKPGVATPSPELVKLRKLQDLFQKNNGLPIFLKGGPKDQLLYRSTLGLCLLGLFLQCKLFYGLII